MADLIDSQDASIASYPYEDIEEGFGYVTYYAAALKDRNTGSPVNTYVLTKQLLFSAHPCVGFKGDGATITTTYYSPAFARPRVLKGTIFTNASSGGNLTSGKWAQMNIRFYHFDGTTSTQIGDQHTGDIMSRSGDGTEYQVETGRITAASPVKFKRGDQLKMEVDAVLYITNGYQWEYGNDPQNRDSDGVSQDGGSGSGSILNPSSNPKIFTQFVVRVPFNLVT